MSNIHSIYDLIFNTFNLYMYVLNIIRKQTIPYTYFKCDHM